MADLLIDNIGVVGPAAISLTLFFSAASHAEGSKGERYTVTPEMCRTHRYVGQEEYSRMKPFDIASICGADALPGTEKFNRYWKDTVNECIEGKQLGFHEKIRTLPLRTGVVPLKCDVIYEMVVSYNVMTRAEIDGLQREGARRNERQKLQIERLKQDSDSGNLAASLILYARSLSLETSTYWPDARRRKEMEELTEKLLKAGKGDNIYAHLLRVEAEYPFSDPQNGSRKQQILQAHGAMARNGYALSTLRIAQEHLARIQEVPKPGVKVDVSGDVYEARQAIQLARQQATGPLSEKVDQLEVLLDKVDPSAAATRIVLGVLAAVVSRLADPKISTADRDDRFLVEWKKENEMRRKQCAETVDMYYRNYDPAGYLPGYGYAVCP
ncbi:hypothetical protein [Methylobacterium radiotolerans]|uniref:hypothetical protein n=1 Tax=Methylobacterium radiotolerans TaxID=31998 RepID=UPI0038D16AC6